MVWVRATALGYHNGLREIGDEFEIPDDFPHESPWWTLAPGRNRPRVYSAPTESEVFPTAQAGNMEEPIEAAIEPRRGPGRPRLIQEG